MIRIALALFLLRKISFAHFNFPHWQSLLAVSWIGLLMGFDPNMRAAPGPIPDAPVWLAVLNGLVMTWVWFLVIVVLLRWWMRRGGRWNGQGDLLNLVATSWLVADTLGVGLIALGVPPVFTLPLWLYSIWVGAKALSGAILSASLGYSLAGILVGLIPAMLASAVVMGVVGFVLGSLGI